MLTFSLKQLRGHLGLVVIAGLFVIAGRVQGQPVALTIVSPNQQTSGGFGGSVVAGPDTSGDGISEILVGALGENPGGSPTNAGRAYLFNGATGGLIFTLNSANQIESGVFGTGVGGLADVTGDSLGDLAIGAPGEDTDGLLGSNDLAGRVYMFNGATGARIRTIESPNTMLYGVFGTSVTALPDITGDARGELVIGAPGESNGGIIAIPDGSGSIYIYNGSNGSNIRRIRSPNAQALGLFGASSAAVPDITGDAKSEIVVGEPGYDPDANQDINNGRAYLYNANTGGLLFTFVDPNQETDGLFGVSLTGLPDITGDGLGDVAIAAPGDNPAGSPNNTGRVYLFNGATHALIATLQSPNQEEGGAFGVPVRYVPDTNGNLTPDLLIGAIGELEDTVTTATKGRAYLFDAATQELLATIDSPNGEFGGGFGVVQGMPDVDGDGRGDAIIGAPGESPGVADSGRVYRMTQLVATPTPTVTPTPDETPTPTPEPTSPCDGRPFGDFNNDGFTDIQDFLLLLDNWQMEYNGQLVDIQDFLNLLDNWQTGPHCA